MTPINAPNPGTVIKSRVRLVPGRAQIREANMTALGKIAAILAIFTWPLAGPIAAEEKVGSTVESRVLLGLNVDEMAIGKWLPEGWQPVTLGQGPMGGSNLILALIDRHVILDADGAPESPASGPTVAFLVYGKSDGNERPRGFVVRVYEEEPLVSPYGNSVAADIGRQAHFSDPGGGARTIGEEWIVQTGSGMLEIDLSAVVRGFRWATGGVSKPYSSLTPDFFRIYRYDQLVGVGKSSAMGIPLAGTATLSVTDPDLAAVFDGSETLEAIVASPVYLRDIYLP